MAGVGCRMAGAGVSAPIVCGKVTGGHLLLGGCLRLRRVQPVGRDEFRSVPPPFAHRLVKPGLWQVCMVTDDDLEPWRKLVHHVAHEFEHGAHRDAVGVLSFSDG